MKNKKIIIYILLLTLVSLIITGCASDQVVKEPDENPIDKAEKPADPVDEGEADEETMEEFKVIAEKSPDPDVLIKYIDENIEMVDKEDADKMISILENSLLDHRTVYEDRILDLDKDNELMDIDGRERDFRESSIDKIKDEKLKVEVVYLYANMYKLTNVEGSFYPIINYDKLKKYDKYLSDQWKDYISVRSLESDDRSMADGGLTISFEELADGIFKTEDYLKNYPDAERRKEILQEYEFKISAYLSGLPNTPIEDYESKKIREEVLESYRLTGDKDYEISAIVGEHLKTIEENDNIIDDQVLLKSYELVKKALLTFEGK